MNARNFGKASAHIERARQILQFGGKRVAVEPIVYLKETVVHGPLLVETAFGGVEIMLTNVTRIRALVPGHSDLMEFTARVHSLKELDDHFLAFVEQWSGERLRVHSMIKFRFSTDQLQQQHPPKLHFIWVENGDGSPSVLQSRSYLIDGRLGWETLKSYAAHPRWEQ